MAQKHQLLFSDRLRGLKHAVMLWRCDIFQSGARSTSYCLTVNSFEFFFFFLLLLVFLPSVQQLPRRTHIPATARELQSEWDIGACSPPSCSSLIISSSLMNASSLTAASSPSRSVVDFSGFPAYLQDINCIYGAVGGGLLQPLGS